jgi:hypothetical protein
MKDMCIYVSTFLLLILLVYGNNNKAILRNSENILEEALGVGYVTLAECYNYCQEDCGYEDINEEVGYSECLEQCNLHESEQ